MSGRLPLVDYMVTVTEATEEWLARRLWFIRLWRAGRVIGHVVHRRSPHIYWRRPHAEAAAIAARLRLDPDHYDPDWMVTYG